MTNEALILEKLARIESQLEPIVKSRQAFLEFKEDLTPLGNTMVKLFIEELQEVETSFQIEDMMLFVKRLARNIRNLTWALKQLENIIEFINDLEPLMKSAVPQLIEHLDIMERRGVFRIITAMLDVRAKIADAYSPEDIEQIGDGAVAMLKVAKKFADPKAVAFIERFAEMTSDVDLSMAKKASPMNLVAAGFNSEVKEGLGVILELTKAMAKLKPNAQLVGEDKLTTYPQTGR